MCGALASLLFVIACGSSNKQPVQPITNTDNPSADDSASKGPGEGRVIQRTQSGGVIELTGDRSASMKQADEEMAAHCGPNNYTIVQEGEEAIANRDGSPGRTDTAWRVHYQCNGAIASPP